MGNRIYGCDDCLAVCPWNKFAVAAREMRYLRGRTRRAAARRSGALDDAGFRARFAGTPIKRIGRDRFLRNVLYAIGNSGDPACRRRRGAVGDARPGGARRGGLGRRGGWRRTAPEAASGACRGGHAEPQRLAHDRRQVALQFRRTGAPQARRGIPPNAGNRHAQVEVKMREGVTHLGA